MLRFKKIIAVFVLFNLPGCLTLTDKNEVKNEVNKNIDEAKNLQQISDSPYSTINIPYSNKIPVPKSQQNILWLKKKKVFLNVDIKKNKSLPLKLILNQLVTSGVNISTTMPLNSYYYRGYPIQQGTDAYTALQILTSAVGLDFKIMKNASGARYVQIVEMGTEEFSLVVPDVKVALELISGGDSEGGNSEDGDSEGSETGSPTGGNQLANTSNISNKVEYKNEFWKSLKEELQSNMVILVSDNTVNDTNVNQDLIPVNFNESYQPIIEPHNEPTLTFNGYKEIKVGRVSINTVTGRIAITAPKHIRDRTIQYLKDIDSVINTRIQVTARIVAVTRSEGESKGIDFAGTKAIGDGWNFVMGNDTLGAITIAQGTSMSNPFGVAANAALGGSMIGIGKDNGAFQAFIDYMSATGETQTMSELSTSVRSGRTVSLSKITNEPRISSSSSSSTSDGTTTGGATNTVTNYETGVITNITPVYDPKRGVVHAIVNTQVILNAGETVQVEPLIAGDSLELIERTLKNTDVITLQTETLSRSGEVIIAGGITTQSQSVQQSGTTWLQDQWFGGLFGKAKQEISYTDYYIILDSTVIPYERMN